MRTGMFGIAIGLVAACSMVAAIAQAPAAAPATSPPTTAPSAAVPNRPGTAPGYLAPGTIDLSLLPPAPQIGDARDAADRRIFLETRKYEGTPRWRMAADDGELGPAAMLRHFSCSLDIELTPQQAPRMVAMLQKATRDAAQAMARGKDFYKRLRPFQMQEGPTCRAREEVASSFDYPSGHTTAGWAWAMSLAQVAPERATPILARGRAIGDSRVICGVHNASAVEAARFITSAAMAAVAASADYQQDLAASRAELAALRAAPHTRPEPGHCKDEAALIGTYW